MATDDDLTEAFCATLQHIEAVHDRQERLLAARIEAENQMLHRIGSMHRCGEISDDQLHELWHQYRALGIDGRSKRWDANIVITWRAMQRRLNEAQRDERHARIFAPNGPEGTWVGAWPRSSDDPAPRSGQAVVYVLFDEENTPCYVGSTSYFRARLSAHAKDKIFARWQAYPCENRELAYQLEVRLLAQHKPRLNQKVGR